jgi:hypothetical protein
VRSLTNWGFDKETAPLAGPYAERRKGRLPSTLESRSQAGHGVLFVRTHARLQPIRATSTGRSCSEIEKLRNLQREATKGAAPRSMYPCRERALTTSAARATFPLRNQRRRHLPNAEQQLSHQFVT